MGLPGAEMKALENDARALLAAANDEWQLGLAATLQALEAEQAVWLQATRLLRGPARAEAGAEAGAGAEAAAAQAAAEESRRRREQREAAKRAIRLVGSWVLDEGRW